MIVTMHANGDIISLSSGVVTAGLGAVSLSQWGTIFSIIGVCIGTVVSVGSLAIQWWKARRIVSLQQEHQRKVRAGTVDAEPGEGSPKDHRNTEPGEDQP